MNNLKRNKRVFYVCNQIEEKGRLIFTEPKKMILNYQPVSMTGEIIAFGSEYINRLIIYTNSEIVKNFHNFDRCYVYREPPTIYDKFCSDADFYVDGDPLIYLTEATVTLNRMTGDS